MYAVMKEHYLKALKNLYVQGDAANDSFKSTLSVN